MLKSDFLNTDENVICIDEAQKRTMNVYKAVMIYLLGGIVGTLWETVLNLVRGDGFVFCNGSLFTPFNFVYGFGALFIILCLRRQTKTWQVFFIGMLGGGAVEYVLSFLEELLMGTRSWDYSTYPLNLNGRTTIPYMFFWGFLCVVVIFLLYKPLDAWLDSLPQKTMRVMAVVFAVIVVADLVLTLGAILRYTARNNGAEALTFIGRLYDRLCDDSFMALRFPSMKVK